MLHCGFELRALRWIVPQPVKDLGEAPLGGIDAAAPFDRFDAHFMGCGCDLRRLLPGAVIAPEIIVVEGDEARRARGGMHGLAIRLALAVNRALGRKGQVVGDRYHARPLTTPRAMRTSMVYVLLNFRKHLRAPACVDPRSSGPHFSGWQHAPASPDANAITGAAPATAPPATWMARVGWRRAIAPRRAARFHCNSPLGGLAGPGLSLDHFSFSPRI